MMDYAEKVEPVHIYMHKKAGPVLGGCYQGLLPIASWMSVMKLLVA